MIVTTSIPYGKEGPFHMERMGDPTPIPGNPPYVCMVMPYPTPQGQQPMYASWKTGANEWSQSPVIGDDEKFQVCTNRAMLQAERGGALCWIFGEGLV